MRFLVLAAIVLWIHLGDLVTAWLYDGGAWPEAGMLRPLRDLMIIIVAGLCLLTVRLPKALLIPMIAYGGITLIYLLLGRSEIALGIRIGSFGTLLIPILLFLVGYYCIRGPEQLRRCIALMAALAIASIVFGAWEQSNTWFWVETINYPSYMLNIKGMLLGANPENGLPWNFYGGVERERRAAGLLASSLALGMFLAMVSIATLASLERRARWQGIALTSLMFIGIWMSGTRGAMLAASLALIGYLATGTSLFRSRLARLIMVAAAFVAIGIASYGIIHASVNFLDGSTIGHWDALKKNFTDLPSVLVVGAGLGAQGGVAGQQSYAAIGGGEGAIFSIAFQLGLPAALLFLWFYANLSLLLWRGYRVHQEPIALAAFWLSCGLATTFVSSEHILTVSGSGAFWLLCGGALRSLSRTSHPVLRESL
ncbi:hypothetical protein IB234_10745 [Pseudomonas sp. PDM16]|uniref:O-antigen ligase family protein n=1 Tax=Pseudomonas sp. PDM16 TaxID=2769292 RepID=UPI00178401FA|nr:hypothetical protein [Pseudomonas sp. PDM16]MBD9415037.1 hypothetical protein [Pseudomonas sp. PDM16]